ncbi:hypothetical protein CAL13_16495 [Bordetella genomosp. 9]|uniref:Outer membrane protein assembly factor BamE n=1 Tax=Bordetella genomosp. 9 TaxID=1416803 RepID=A0A1W6Z2X8_9BORD|nr:hypothetical protein CAL13_16495 [Bordetella genomosp. 9]
MITVLPESIHGGRSVSTIARTTSRRLKAVFAVAAIATALAGCTSDKWGFPYKAPIQQGNWITSEQVALLRPGMTREQVRFALGSPTLTDVLHSNRWDYPYYYKPGYGPAQERKFTVWFENDQLVRWEGDKQPDVQPFQIADEPGKAAPGTSTGGGAARGAAAAGTDAANPGGAGLPAGVAPSDRAPADAAPAGGAPAQGASPGTPSSATPTGAPGAIPASPAQPMQ